MSGEHAVGPQPIRVSAVKYRRPVGKKLELSENGGHVEKTPLLDMRNTAGELQNLSFGTAEDAFMHRLQAGPETMFLSGTFDPALENALVVPKGRVTSDDQSVDRITVAATKEYLAFRSGPGLISIDVDTKSVDEVKAIFPEGGAQVFSTAQEALDGLYEVLPEARGCPVQVMPSSGSMIVKEPGGELIKGPGGWRILLATADATQTPRILETIHARCWSRGRHIFAFVSRGGQFLARSLADQALKRPTQPDYPTASLGHGLKKVPDAHLVMDVDGALLDPSTVVLSIDERRAADENLARARDALEPERKRAEAAHTEAVKKDMVARGVPSQRAQKAAKMRVEGGVILAPDTVVFADGDAVTVGTLLSPAGSEYDGKQCLDPLEPDYDGARAVGIFYWNDGEDPGIFSFARGSRFFRLRYDVDGAMDAIRSTGSDQSAVVRVLALSELSQLDTRTVEREAARVLGLGNSRRELRAEVAQLRVRLRASDGDAEQGKHEFGGGFGLQDLGDPLGAESFPHTRARASGPPEVLDHPANLAHLTDRYGIQLRYNMITKSMEWDHPDIPSAGDNAENRLFSELLGLASLNAMPKTNLDTHLLGLGDARSYNPVTDYFCGLRWDGLSRFDRLAAQLGASDPIVAAIALRVFLLQACAAADHAERARAINSLWEAHFEYVIVLLGEQGEGKTKGFKKLLPQPLRGYYREGQVLNLNDKDSMKQVLSNWIVELGELDATFGKSAVSQKKAFLSRSTDEIRAPYARKASVFGRRTVFVGTVNEESFLADETGNRRYIPLTVGRLDVGWSEQELEQLWAEAWHRYSQGEAWWPYADEELVLKRNADKYRVRTEIEELVTRHYAWGEVPRDRGARKTALQIYEEVTPHNARRPVEKDLKTVGSTLKRLWSETGLVVMRDGQLMLRSKNGALVSVNAQSGKNRGWLLPPKAAEAQVFDVGLGGRRSERRGPH
ncbi:VapE domain-containing protein [Roseicyclus persicicus]|uniref:Virulence-associated protein E-like domain-containing protein n=1 Tax=Roseicyclus persicicus TaxID=2650661 RepID=A0A7X6JZJ4_9RHOB|nr:VapE domain-containing protein [Roseibacterium persicicum]NKX44878.1 hypothetical protein [Roseibacterium persicicum]